VSGVAVRRAGARDVAFLAEVVSHAEVAPFLAAVRPADAEALAAEVARAEADPEAYGLFVIENEGVAVGTVAFERVNRRSRIAQLEGMAIHPDARRPGVALEAVRLFLVHLVDTLGFHRVQCEVYAFNHRALAFFERAGFTREGVHRRAYWRNGRWVDGILFGLLDDEIHRDG
jgi:RimJ/RimL family protein N-acetyltransferase